MNSIVKKGMLGLTAIASMAAMATPADAQRYRGGYHGGYHGNYYGHHHGNAAGAAVLGGIVGLGVGAAIASGNRGYYGGGGYGYAPGYYGYGGGSYYAPRCWTQWSWDPYYGRQVPVQVCR